VTQSGPDELSNEVKAQLARIFELVSRWCDRIQAVPAVPAIGSSLRKDDEVTDPYQLSHAVVGALVSAVDHLDAVRALVQDAGVVHARAPFTLMRAALENSATAVWLIAPASRDERVLRRLRLQWDDARDGEKACRLVGAEPPLSRDGWKAKLERVARARGLSDEQIGSVTRQKATYSEIVKTAGDEARGPDVTGQNALFCWMAASGIAHARLWAVLSSVLDRAVVPGVLEDPVGMMLSASDKAVAVIAGVTTLMVTEGWRLLDERCQSMWDSPPAGIGASVAHQQQPFLGTVIGVVMAIAQVVGWLVVDGVDPVVPNPVTGPDRQRRRSAVDPRCFLCALTALPAFVRVGRWYRNIKPPDPKARRTRSGG
jgi:hypothetical protein